MLLNQDNLYKLTKILVKMECYDVVVGHLSGNISEAGDSYRIERGVIFLKVPFGVERLCGDVPELSKEGEQLPETIEDVLFQNGVVLS